MTDTGKLMRGYITPKGNYAVNIRNSPHASGLLLGKFSGLYEIDRSQDSVYASGFAFYYVEFVTQAPGPGDNVQSGWVAFDFISWLPAAVYDPGTPGESGVTHFLTILEAYLKLVDLLFIALQDFQGTLIETKNEIERGESQ